MQGQPLVELDRGNVPVHPGENRTACTHECARRPHRIVLDEIVLEETDDDEVGRKAWTDLEELREFLTRVVAGDRGVPHLPVDIGTPRLQLSFEQIRVRVL